MVGLIRRAPWEALIWLGGLLALALFPAEAGGHFTLCPLSNAGFDFCPGCGLGHSISYLLHGELALSISAHPLGIFAVIILSYRILQLTRPYFLHLWPK